MRCSSCELNKAATTMTDIKVGDRVRFTGWIDKAGNSYPSSLLDVGAVGTVVNVLPLATYPYMVDFLDDELGGILMLHDEVELVEESNIHDRE